MTKKEEPTMGDYMMRLFAGEWKIRPVENYGDVNLSVQASTMHYSKPRIDGLTIDEYEKVEIALLKPSGVFLKPSDIDLPNHLAELFESGKSPVAGYITQAQLKEVREFLQNRKSEIPK